MYTVRSLYMCMYYCWMYTVSSLRRGRRWRLLTASTGVMLVWSWVRRRRRRRINKRRRRRIRWTLAPLIIITQTSLQPPCSASLPLPSTLCQWGRERKSLVWMALCWVMSVLDQSSNYWSYIETVCIKHVWWGDTITLQEVGGGGHSFSDTIKSSI